MTQTVVKPMAFKDELKRLRTAKGLTQMQLAAQAGLTLSAVTQMELGKVKNPRLDSLKALSRVLGCSIDDLAKDDGGDEPPKGKKGGTR